MRRRRGQALGRLRVGVDGEPLIGQRTGVGTFCLHMIESLVAGPGAPGGELDLGIYAVTWRSRPELERRLPAGCQLIGRPMPARPVRTLWDRGIDLPLEPFTGRLDVVHGTNYVVPPTIRAAQVVSVYDLTTVHFPEMCEPATLAFPRLVRRAVERGAWVHTMSEFVAAEVVEEFGADPTRVRVVLPGVPPLDPHLSRSPGAVGPEPVAEPEVGPFGRYVLAIGTVEPRKDYPGLVQAFEKVAGGRPDLGLVICGRDGWGAEEFRRAWEASPVRDRIVRPGYLDDRSLARLLRGAALLAYPSRYEGFGLPPLQAMADGVPVVATAAGSVPEVVGDAALVVEPGDTDGLAGAMERVLDDPGLAASLSRAGVERAGAFSWERCASGMADLYRDAAGA